MLSTLARGGVPLGRRAVGTSVLRQSGYHPTVISVFPDDYTKPTSVQPLFKNEFVNKPPAEHQKDVETCVKPPVTSDPWPSTAGDPHAIDMEGIWLTGYNWAHYDTTWEPVQQRHPDVAKGELVAGAAVTRTDVWKREGEPSIQSIARMSPDHFRPVGYAENAPCPESTVPTGHLDCNDNRLPVEHADRRAFIYLTTATLTMVNLTLIRSLLVKAVYSLWPSKDVFAAGVIEVDLRPIRVGQNFLVKWRGKPVFVKRRTQEQIDLCRKEDALVASFRDPELDSKRCPRPEWLICIGVCTHLGCIPYADQGQFGGYFCPCHGSHYDYSGRIRAGPAPTNLELPPVQWLDDVTIKIG
jgi:ubiquinol-cytochrome c reductase iron-sulfur subunit